MNKWMVKWTEWDKDDNKTTKLTHGFVSEGEAYEWIRRFSRYVNPNLIYFAEVLEEN